jgi:hypothetical protein
VFFSFLPPRSLILLAPDFDDFFLRARTRLVVPPIHVEQPLWLIDFEDKGPSNSPVIKTMAPRWAPAVGV